MVLKSFMNITNYAKYLQYLTNSKQNITKIDKIKK